MAYFDRFEFTALPEERQPPALALLLAGQRLVPGRGVAPATGPRQRRGQPGHAHRAGRLTGRDWQERGSFQRSRIPLPTEIRRALHREIRSCR